MYKWYALKRILRGVIIYSILIFIFSFLFNQINEKVQRSQILEMVRAEAKGLKNMTAEQIMMWRKDQELTLIKQYKLDRPLVERVLNNAKRILTFDFGKSTTIKSLTGSQEVIKILGEAIPRTLLLFTTAFVISTLIGLALGLKKAQKPGGRTDKVTSLITLIIYGMPTWWLAMLLIFLFVYTAPLFPSGGVNSVPVPEGIWFVFDRIKHLALPILTLVCLGFWSTAYVIRNLVLGTLQEDFIMSARARGIPEKKVLHGHTLRTCAPPLVTMILLSFLASMAGNIIFEGIFSWPGLGQLYWIAVQQNDIPVLMGDLAITTGLYQMGLIVLDLIYGFLDPRIKVGGKA
ncbi:MULTISPECIES: ABC transporter permease [unclassified Treponema]|uniref:ABC transporter permease n=1 Tax=unclassified Treponema TaxID=2638727 RepID=UPI0020A28D81|nr:MULTISPECIES: ABC transporter permease [unclassified Treponema]UTC65958.1 ABC transporter permease [Treponema sp. OMZ 789]UTC68687.1 ABC transporter permease [Treponema sp. OMZ 790]UTC71417.1 ABC transporter permease [Treponema sp. OMZ 791]